MYTTQKDRVFLTLYEMRTIKTNHKANRGLLKKSDTRQRTTQQNTMKDGCGKVRSLKLNWAPPIGGKF